MLTTRLRTLPDFTSLGAMNGQNIPSAGTGLPAERRSWVLQRLAESGVVRTQDVADGLGVSVETVRRDLAVLESEGMLERVHGGAASVGRRQVSEPAYGIRAQQGSAEKQAIGVVAASLVKTDYTVFIDIGTTALEVVRALPQDFQGRVVTYSLPIAQEVSSRFAAEVLLGGGRLRPGDLATSGRQTLDLFADIRADLALLSCGGASAEAGVTDFHLGEVDAKRLMIKNSARRYLLADSSKFGQFAPYHVADWGSFTGMVSDRPPTGVLAEALRSAGVETVTR